MDTASTFEMLLMESGYDVQTAHDGATAIQMAVDHRPDVVLLDIGLPGWNGYEVARRMRKEVTLQGIVLVALTGYGQETDREASHQAGFDYHLVKPTNFDDVSRILATVSLGTEEKRSADEKALD